jgi:hypothetical protein
MCKINSGMPRINYGVVTSIMSLYVMTFYVMLGIISRLILGGVSLTQGLCVPYLRINWGRINPPNDVRISWCIRIN